MPYTVKSELSTCTLFSISFFISFFYIMQAEFSVFRRNIETFFSIGLEIKYTSK